MVSRLADRFEKITSSSAVSELIEKLSDALDDINNQRIAPQSMLYFVLKSSKLGKTYRNGFVCTHR